MEPLSWERANEVSGKRRGRLIGDLAGFLAILHDTTTLDAVRQAGVRLVMPEPLASTAEIRTRFGRHIESSQRSIVVVRVYKEDASQDCSRPSSEITLALVRFS